MDDEQLRKNALEYHRVPTPGNFMIRGFGRSLSFSPLIPTLDPRGLIALAVLLAGAGALLLYRRA